jgi:solute carrier family 25 carnitine/acylcarnitine transporter 20/29
MKLWLVDFISGSVSGILGTFIGHPLDTIKCRLQVYSKEYANTLASMSKIVKEEKLRGLFKGVVPPMLNQFPINAM